MRRALVVALAGILCLTAAAGVGVGTGAPSTPTDTAAVDTTLTVERTNDTAVRYHYTFDPAAGVESVRVQVYGGRITDETGLSRFDGSRMLEWTGESRATLTVVQRVRAEQSRCLCVATERWLAVEPLAVTLTAVGPEGTTRTHVPGDGADPAAGTDISATDGLFTSGVAYFGPVEMDSTAGPTGERIRVLAPVGPGQADAETVLSSVSEGAARVDLTSGSARPATVVVIPHTNRTVVGQGPNVLDARGVTRSEGYAFVDGATGPQTWLHEYVHTQENYSTGPAMAWYTEGSAEYLGRLLAARERGDTVESVARDFRSIAPGEAVLGDRSTWDSVWVPYRQGGRLLAAVDWEIRRLTDGSHTLADVYRRLNDRPSLTLPAFVETVHTVAGTDDFPVDIEAFVHGEATLDAWGPSATATASAAATPPAEDPVDTSTAPTTERGSAPTASAAASTLARPLQASALLALLVLVVAVRRRRY